MSLTEAGRAAIRSRRNARAARLAEALARDFSPAELARLRDVAPLIERLAERI
jgi:DNA-binding MarR family transcriptional regulator